MTIIAARICDKSHDFHLQYMKVKIDKYSCLAVELWEIITAAGCWQVREICRPRYCHPLNGTETCHI